MKSLISKTGKGLNQIIHRMGHILSLVASLALWVAIYSTIQSVAISEQGSLPKMAKPTQLHNEAGQTQGLQHVSNAQWTLESNRVNERSAETGI